MKLNNNFDALSFNPLEGPEQSALRHSNRAILEVDRFGSRPASHHCKWTVSNYSEGDAPAHQLNVNSDSKRHSTAFLQQNYQNKVSIDPASIA